MFDLSKMGCGDGPNVGTPQCPDLQQYYNQVHRTNCHKHPHCPKPSKKYPSGWTSYHKYSRDCPPFQSQRCCSPLNPPHWGPADFQCCSGQITGDARKGYCNAESCSYSSWCNQYMLGVCPIPGNLDAWFTKDGNCGTYVQAMSDSKDYKTGATIVGNWVANTFSTPFNKNYLTNENWKKWVYVAKTYCPKYPGVCDSTLEKFCSTVTRKDVIQNPNLRDLCGCFMPEKQYPYSGFVSRGCAVTCNGQDNIKCGKSTNRTNGCVCDQTVCIIDNVDINMVNSEGHIDLNEICGSAGNSVCLIKDVNVNEINSRVGGGVQVDQQCQRCYKWVGSKEDEKLLFSLPGKITSKGWVPPPGWVETPCTGRNNFPFADDRKWVLIGVILLFFLGLILVAFLIWRW